MMTVIDSHGKAREGYCSRDVANMVEAGKFLGVKSSGRNKMIATLVKVGYFTPEGLPKYQYDNLFFSVLGCGPGAGTYAPYWTNEGIGMTYKLLSGEMNLDPDIEWDDDMRQKLTDF